MFTFSALKRLLVPLFLIICMVSALGLLTSVAGLADVNLEFEVGEVELDASRPVQAQIVGGGCVLQTGQ